MDGDVELLKRIYDRFNARDIDGVLAVLVSPGPTVWMVATSMAARPYASSVSASHRSNDKIIATQCWRS